MRFVVVDLEATCWSKETEPELYKIQSRESEIIEIGAVVLDEDLSVVSEFQRFVRPIRHENLSEFCVSLTNIGQDDVDKADEFATVYHELVAWMGGETDKFRFVSWGSYDDRQIRRQCRACGIEEPSWIPIDAKDEFVAWYRGQTGQRCRVGLLGAIQHLNMSFEGTAHRGIDDARNLVRIFQHILDPKHLSKDARKALSVLRLRTPKASHLGHMREAFSDAKGWFHRVGKELKFLGLAEDLGGGKGLTLTDKGRVVQIVLPDITASSNENSQGESSAC